MSKTPASPFAVPDELEAVFRETDIILPESRAHLYELAFMGEENDLWSVNAERSYGETVSPRA